MIILLVLTLVLQPGLLVDRTVAIVDGRTITLSDARVAVALGLVEGESVDADVVDRLIDRELMLRETNRYTPPDPPAEAIDARMDRARQHAGGEAALERVLESGGFSQMRLRGWIRDDLRIAAYLEQRFVMDDRRADLIADWVEDLRRRTSITVIPQ